MDAAEDREVKLQRASSDLVAEFSAKLPSLLWRSQNGTPLRTPRKWAPVSKTERLVSLLEPFQEWPQLLDPHLQKLLPPLVDAFLAYLVRHRDQYGSQSSNGSQSVALYPLPRVICRLLYTFCKVRGVKVISRFLNNEPKHLESMLRAFIQWNSISNYDAIDDLAGPEPQGLQWEERYVMLIWLSHLLLAPFDLSSISSDDIPVPYDNLQQLRDLSPKAPVVTKSLLSLALYYINASGKEREAATVLLARLVLRGDMQALGLLPDLIQWAFKILQSDNSEQGEGPSVYSCIGILSFISRVVGSGHVEDLAPLFREVFEKTLRISQSKTEVSKTIQNSALARKIVVKILRNITGMALSLIERGDVYITEDQLSAILEDAIDHFLVALADKDTPVRFSASKALSVITLKLDSEMGAEIIEAVIGSLGENILYEKHDGTLLTPFEARDIGTHTLRRNLSGVDAQRWQGLMLTLSHLLFRRAPPLTQLPDILESLVSGLDFEQRSSTGSSVGTGVRDAACFGVWALSRKYNTSELQALPLQTIPSLFGMSEVDVLQKIAVELVCSACIDPSGNIRRGASAALQELIGRHPDMITEGISLVQVVDYHSVARRSRAIVDVAKATASLDTMYWGPLLGALMQWRGIGCPDAESRRQAANSIGSLSSQQHFKTINVVLERLLNRLPRILRSDVESRHGCLLSIAATVDAYISEWNASSETRENTEGSAVSSQVTKLWEIFESSLGPTDNDLTLQNSRPELTAEASSRLIASLCRATVSTGLSHPSEGIIDRSLKILSLCVSRSEDISIETSSDALASLFPLLSSKKQEETVQAWFNHLRTSSKLPTGRGQILALGAVFKQLEGREELLQSIITELLQCAARDEVLEKRIVAVRCFATSILPYTGAETELSLRIATNLLDFLNDYTTDRRGDVGSLIRVEAIQAARVLQGKLVPHSPLVHDIVGCLCRLACEKLDKVRLQAWLCLQDCVWELADEKKFLKQYEHASDVSSTEYFYQLLTLWSHDWLRLPILQGLATSAVTGSEGLVRSSREAVIQFFNAIDPNSTTTNSRHAELVVFLQVLSTTLGDNITDDRYAIPIVEFIAFLIDSYYVPSSEDLDLVFRRIFVLAQKAHFRSTNIPRLEAGIKVYAALSRVEALRNDVLKKLTGMLLHPFPRVRSSAADYIFTITGSEVVKYEDWSTQPTELKGKVEGLRSVLLTM